jgi:hypothetical protein
MGELDRGNQSRDRVEGLHTGNTDLNSLTWGHEGQTGNLSLRTQIPFRSTVSSRQTGSDVRLSRRTIAPARSACAARIRHVLIEDLDAESSAGCRFSCVVTFAVNVISFGTTTSVNEMPKAARSAWASNEPTTTQGGHSLSQHRPTILEYNCSSCKNKQ